LLSKSERKRREFTLRCVEGGLPFTGPTSFQRGLHIGGTGNGNHNCHHIAVRLGILILVIVILVIVLLIALILIYGQKSRSYISP